MSRLEALSRASTWAKTGPSARLIVGVGFICLVGYMGLTPKSLFGVTLTWPHAALWGAVGWGLSGLSIRPMFVLAVLGLLQDMAFAAPFGCFMLVNLVAYAVSAWLAEHFDVQNDPTLQSVVPVAVVFAGFLTLGVLAASNADRTIDALSLVFTAIVTIALYYPISGLFQLGARLDDLGGRVR